ncbi:MAG: hypothetical protein HYY14_02025 [Candidatus Omnitrophica bacterium]|nr:hypothetical protein [Candidatus Omnitrophota bacterium]
MRKLTSHFTRFIGLCAALGLIFLSCAQPALAMKVAPAVVEMYIPPGGEYEGEFEVTNTADAAVVIQASFEDESEWERALVGEGRDAGALKAWLTLKQVEIALRPGESGKLAYKVAVPKEGVQAELKGHVFFEQRALEEGEGAVSVVARIGNAVYCIIRGTEDIRAKVTEFSFQPDSQVFRVAIQNEGNVHIRPKGELVITPAGEVGAEGAVVVPVNERGHPLMYQESAPFTIRLDKPLPPGKYHAKVELVFGNPVVILKEEMDLTVHPSEAP